MLLPLKFTGSFSSLLHTLQQLLLLLLLPCLYHLLFSSLILFNSSVLLSNTMASTSTAHHGSPSTSTAARGSAAHGSASTSTAHGASTSTAHGASSSAASPATRRHPRRRPINTRFFQQQLPANRPFLTPLGFIAFFFFLSVLLISIGVASLIASAKVVQIVHRYDDACIPLHVLDHVAYIKSSEDKTCHLQLNVTKDMKSPIYVYYQLENFYQNYGRYVKSRSDEQLMDSKEENTRGGCRPEDFSNSRWPNHPVVPCGLIAWSLFNDTYSFSRYNSDLPVNKKGISWKSDREHKFGKHVFPKNFQNNSVVRGAHLNESIPLSEQEDLIVWMRIAAFPTLRKMYGKIEVVLYEGDIVNVTLQNNYNTYSFNGKKKLVLSTISWLGGKHDALGYAYLAIGGLCFFWAMFLSILTFIKRRKLGDPSSLSWNRDHAE